MDETGINTCMRVSQMEEKSQAKADNKENIRNSAYTAATNAEGVHLTSGCQRNINHACQRLYLTSGCQRNINHASQRLGRVVLEKFLFLY